MVFSTKTQTGNVAADPKRSLHAKCMSPSPHFRSLASSVIALRTDLRDHKAVGVCACHKNHGSTTVASNLAIAITDAVDGRVLLVQADMESSDIAKNFGIPRTPGWTDAYLEQLPLSEAIFESTIDRLSVMGAGDLGKEYAVTYEVHRLRAMVEVLKEEFEFVVFDMPEANELSGNFALAQVLDGTLLVVQADRVSSGRAVEAKDKLVRHGANIIGAVLNKKRYYAPSFLRGK